MRSRALYLLAVCQRIGVHRSGPHKHNDWLSFELCVHGRPVIVDPGTYCYTGQPEQRALFRSTAYHNTVVVDGQEQVQFAAGSFAFDRPRGDVRVLRWVSDARRDLLEAEHTGYMRLRQPVRHRRCFELDKDRERVVITDTFTGEGEHLLEWFLHFDVGQNCRLLGQEAVVSDGERPLLHMALPQDAEPSMRPAWVSEEYNRRQEAECLAWGARMAPVERRQFVLSCTLPEGM